MGWISLLTGAVTGMALGLALMNIALGFRADRPQSAQYFVAAAIALLAAAVIAGPQVAADMIARAIMATP